MDEKKNCKHVIATFLYVEDEIISFWLLRKDYDNNYVEYFDSIDDMMLAWIRYKCSGVTCTIAVYNEI